MALHSDEEGRSEAEEDEKANHVGYGCEYDTTRERRIEPRRRQLLTTVPVEFPIGIVKEIDAGYRRMGGGGEIMSGLSADNSPPLCLPLTISPSLSASLLSLSPALSLTSYL